MLHRDGEVLDYGRAERTAPAALYNALVVRDGGCRFPGCDRPPEDCEVHHVKPFSVGGETDIDECVLGCWAHHPILHREGWGSALARDATFTVTSPTGVTQTSRPRVVVLEQVRNLINSVAAANDDDDNDAPIVKHAWWIDQELGARKRIDALINEARMERAVINLFSFGTRWLGGNFERRAG